MKKILQVFFTFAIIFTFAGCSNSTENSRNTSSVTSAVSENYSTDEHNKSKTDRIEETTTVKKIMSINIIVGNKTFTAALEDNDTVKALVKQLPITIDMSDLNGNEKYYYLSGNLSADTSTSPGRINEGDLMLYGNNCLVLFYETFNTSYSYVKIGHIENTTGLTNALGSGSVKITFSLSE